MKHYYLTLAGLQIELLTPQEITISESLQPFLCRNQEKTDFTIEIYPCKQLPDFSDNGVWHGLEYYDYHDGSLRIFHYDAPSLPAFAVTNFFANKNIQIQVSPDFLSYFTGTSGIFNRIGMETLLLQHNALLLHASLIKFEGKAIAFSGPSGVGKSTHANIWQNFFGAEILNGDRAVLRNENGEWTAHGSPYAGTSKIYKNDCAPLSAIVLLQQAKENRLSKLNQTDAFRLLYPQFSVHRWEKNFVAKVTDLSLKLLEEIPVYLLECLPEENAAILVKKGLGL